MASRSKVGGLSADEESALNILKENKRGLSSDDLRTKTGWETEKMMDIMNSLSGKQFVDFTAIGKSGKLGFKARSMEDAAATVGMKDEERIIYRIVKEAGNTGVWVKQLKERSGLHAKLADTVIKGLEKKNVIKWIKPVKTPFKKTYLLFELEPSTELTGGAWYTDNEMDIDFIEQLSLQLHRYIVKMSFPKTPNAIYPASYTNYPTASQVHKFLSKSGLINVPLSLEDVKQILDRLYYDGKVVKLPKLGQDFSDQSEPEDLDADEQVVDLEDDMWMYKAVNGAIIDERNAWTDMPCGKCPVFEFCSETGPVNPGNCKYFKDWLTP
ncbi:34-kDa subunit of RNA polymerase III (C) [Gaertneriomyces sp. JEL0708]|nr:34-kDa subunit of RNA polymerase III (C) [Gaertneriomyces sp. JEL0708]